jgi:hypothetical protein
MASLVNLLLETKGSVLSKLNGKNPEGQYARDMTDNKSLHQVNGPDLNMSALDLDAKKPDGYKNPETGTTYP